MFCPHCNNKIPDGSNICPLCYANLAGVKQQAQETRPERQDGVAQEAPRPRASKKPAAYTKGSRGTKRSADRTPMIIAFGLIVILVEALLCLMATALALYHQAGWSFGKANPVRGMTFTLIAGIYAFAAMPAAAGTADLLALTAIGLWMLLHAAVLPGAPEKTAEKPKEK